MMDDLRDDPCLAPGPQRRAPARHPAGLPRDARHPLGLRLPDWRRRGDRRGRRRGLAGGRRLRHQLRRPAAALRSEPQGRRCPGCATARRRSCSSTCPTGVGSTGSDLRARRRGSCQRSLARRRRWAVERGFGAPADLEHIEEGGRLAGRRSGRVSARAPRARAAAARHARVGQPLRRDPGRQPRSTTRRRRGAFGLALGQVTVMIHSGSRGPRPPGLRGPPARDGQARRAGTGSTCPTASSPARRSARRRGGATSAAMAAAANFAFANRQVMCHWVRESVRRRVRDGAPDRLGSTRLRRLPQHREVRDASTIDGRARRVCVHRKGATRAYPPGTRRCRPPTATWASRCSSPATWAATRTCWPGRPGPCARRFGSTCHGAGGG